MNDAQSKNREALLHGMQQLQASVQRAVEVVERLAIEAAQFADSSELLADDARQVAEACGLMADAARQIDPSLITDQEREAISSLASPFVKSLDGCAAQLERARDALAATSNLFWAQCPRQR